MKGWAQQHLPCPCGKSSDAYSVNHEGWGTCFSCEKRFPPNSEASLAVPSGTPGQFVPVEFRALKKRNITEETAKRYGYGFTAKNHHAWVLYNKSGVPVAQKFRGPDKEFYIKGDISQAEMFGSRTIRGGGKQIVIAEGELDAMSINQALGGTWPVLSLKNGASGAANDISEMLETLENFERVVLAFDDDRAGRGALEACCTILSPGKIFVAQYGGAKDASELLQAGKSEELRNAVWGAKQWRPDGVINLADARDAIRKKPMMGIPYPWAGLNELLFGYRPAELTTWTAGTGVGKTAVVSEVAHFAAVHEKKTVGLLYLEEGIDRAGKRIVGIEMNLPIHLPNAEYSDEDFDRAFDATLGTDRFFAYDHFGSLDSDVLLNRIRYMIKHCGCEIVVLDHISIVVSGNDISEDERRTLDHLVTNLRSMTQETNASLHLVSHLKRPPGAGSHEEGRQVSLSHLRGTQAIAQLSDTVIACERNQQADNPQDRNTTVLRVLKNRYAGLTGEADHLYYDMKTGRLSALRMDAIPASAAQSKGPQGDF